MNMDLTKLELINKCVSYQECIDECIECIKEEEARPALTVIDKILHEGALREYNYTLENLKKCYIHYSARYSTIINQQAFLAECLTKPLNPPITEVKNYDFR